MARLHNFNPGPAALPLPVLTSVQKELVDYAGQGLSVMEMSHRSSAFASIVEEAEATLRRIMNIPATYDVLFLSGGATLQFAAVPMNLMKSGRAGYIVSGHFSQMALNEATKYGKAFCLASSEDTNFDRIPKLPERPLTDLDYLHLCQNNTVFGTMWRTIPPTGETPLVADISSCFLSFPVDVTRYGVLYAGAQKNAGPAGVTVVIVRHDLVEKGPALGICPSYVDWRRQALQGSRFNTPNTFGIYVCAKVFKWVEEMGGLEAMEARNNQKASLLYDAIDASKLFFGTALPSDRSIANVTFSTNIPELDREFIAEAERAGLIGLAGHRLVGGMRASIYNAVPKASVERLVELIEEFEELHAGTNAKE